MGRRGRKSRNLVESAHVRLTPDVVQIIETAAEQSECSVSDVIRTCVEAGLTNNSTAPVALKQMQRKLEDRRLP